MARKSRDQFVHTAAHDGPVHCAHCGRKVRGRLGNVCSHPDCHKLALAAAESGKR